MPELQMEPIPALRVDVVRRPETAVAYVRRTGPYFGDEKLFQRLFGTLYRWANPRGLVTRGVTEELIIYHDDPDTVAQEKLRVSCRRAATSRTTGCALNDTATMSPRRRSRTGRGADSPFPFASP